jgi:hypothetical protein
MFHVNSAEIAANSTFTAKIQSWITDNEFILSKGRSSGLSGHINAIIQQENNIIGKVVCLENRTDSSRWYLYQAARGERPPAGASIKIRSIPMRRLPLNMWEKIDNERNLKVIRAGVFVKFASPTIAIMKVPVTQSWSKGESYLVREKSTTLGRGLVFQVSKDEVFFSFLELNGPIETMLNRRLLFVPLPLSGVSLKNLDLVDSDPFEIKHGINQGTSGVDISSKKQVTIPEYHLGDSKPLSETNYGEKPPNFMRITLGSETPFFQASRENDSNYKRVRIISGSLGVSNIQDEKYAFSANYEHVNTKQITPGTDSPAKLERFQSHTASTSMKIKHLSGTKFVYIASLQFESATTPEGLLVPKARWTGSPLGLGYAIFESTAFSLTPGMFVEIDQKIDESFSEDNPKTIIETKTSKRRYGFALEASSEIALTKSDDSDGPKLSFTDSFKYRPAYNEVKKMVEWKEDAPIENIFSVTFNYKNSSLGWYHEYTWDRQLLKEDRLSMNVKQSFKINFTFEI